MTSLGGHGPCLGGLAASAYGSYRKFRFTLFFSALAELLPTGSGAVWVGAAECWLHEQQEEAKALSLSGLLLSVACQG